MAKKATKRKADDSTAASQPQNKRPKGAARTASGDNEEKKKKQQKSWEERKEKLQKAIDNTNEKIKDTDEKAADFYKAFIDVPANIRVKITALKDADKTNLDKEKTRLANFSYSLLKLSKSNKQKTPEIQTGIVEDKNSKEQSIHISGNDDKSNKFLQEKAANQSLSKFYGAAVRPSHIKRKKEAFKKQQKNIYPIAGEVGKAAINSNKEVAEDADVTKLEIMLEITHGIHKKAKTDDDNRRMKSARAFVKKRGFQQSKINIPANKERIHAETAILKSIEKLDVTLKSVGGTKVACTACQAFFKAQDQRDLLGDETSFAWLSKSSMAQLGFDAKEFETYLLKIKEILKDELEKLKFYNVADGTIKTAQMTMEDDDTDSEDEDAIWEMTMETPEISEEADKIIDSLKKNAQKNKDKAPKAN